MRTNTVLWGIQGLLAALFAFAGAMKLVLPVEAMQQGPMALPGPFLRFIGVAEVCGAVVRRNADEGVTWLHSYVSDDGNRTFCVYDGPTPEAIRKAAAVNELPVDRITRISVLDPYFRL